MLLSKKFFYPSNKISTNLYVLTFQKGIGHHYSYSIINSDFFQHFQVTNLSMIPLEDFLVTHLHKRPHEVEEFDDVGVRCTCVSSCCTKLQHQRKQTTLHNIRPLLKESVLETYACGIILGFHLTDIQYNNIL